MTKELKQPAIPNLPSSYMTEGDTRGLIDESLSKFGGVFRVLSGNAQSGNFVTGSTGWSLDSGGDIEANSGTFRGTITATSGTIGGWTIGATSLKSGTGATTVALDSGGTNPAFYAGSATPATAPFRVTTAGALIATGASISGTITATGGSITGALTITGNLSVTSGSIITGSATTERIVLNEAGSTGLIKFYYDSVETGKMGSLVSGDVYIESQQDHYFATPTLQIMRMIDDGNVQMRTATSKIYWASGRGIEDGGSYLESLGDFRVSTGSAYYVGTDGGDTNTLNYKDHSGNNATATIKGGIVTATT